MKPKNDKTSIHFNLFFLMNPDYCLITNEDEKIQDKQNTDVCSMPPHPLFILEGGHAQIPRLNKINQRSIQEYTPPKWKESYRYIHKKV